MGVLPVGFFSPLPLAMMIPFMATQSLAMGEAFGKSFQFGKRKISSMSNEDFNKLTFPDLMSDQTANIHAILPMLSAQMKDSQDMQKQIFKEMVNLIPIFVNEMAKATDSFLGNFFTGGNYNPEPYNQNPTLDNNIVQATTQPPPTQIEDVPYTQNVTPPTNEPEINQQERAQFQRTVETAHINTLKLLESKLYQYPNWQKSLIIAELNKRKTTTTTQTPTATIPDNVPLSTYETEKFRLMQIIVEKQEQVLIWEQDIKAYLQSGTAQVTTTSAKQKQLSIAQTAKARAIKMLQNFILLSRNNRTLQAVATRDWNARVWNFGIGS